jgi:protein TonB
MRATSLSAAALLLGAAVIAAFSMRFITWTPPDSVTPVIDWWKPKAEPPKPEPPKLTPPRPIEPRPTISGPTVDPTRPAEPASFPVGPVTTIGPPEPIVITRPDWLQRPTPEALARYYPERARERGREGLAQLDCVVRVDGRLDCTVVSETPANWRFGEAALRISRDYRMVPATRDGVPVEAAYRMRVPFNLN